MTLLLRMKFILKSAFLNLWRTPRRTVVSLAAIAVASLSLVLFQSFTDGVRARFRKNLITSNYAHFQIFKRGYRENKADDAFGYQIKDFSELKATIEKQVGPLSFLSRREEFYGLLNFGDRSIGAKGIGIDAEQEQKFMTLNQVILGKHLAGSGPNRVFLGTGLADQVRAKVGSTVTLVVNTAGGSMNAVDFEVVGTFRTGVLEIDNAVFYVHFEDAAKLLRVEGASHLILAFADDEELKFQAPLKAAIAARFPQLEVTHWHDLIGDLFDNSMRWLDTLFTVFRAIVLVVATLSIANVFTVSLFERLGEFGTLRALGTHRREILGLIFTESLLQSTLGGLLGLGLSLALIYLALPGGLTLPPPANMSVPFHVSFQVPWFSLPSIFLLCVAIAGGSGILPAYRMARVEIVRALGRNV